ncbi:hypothetical protein HJG60_008564 [Phyllostomus discolor]|uniref:Uncharacterized protein n=1 Tax=Phyllostomus discolor TaxID=89673 RepID=A0A833Z1I3_9CHIR|nr:hypothetical protein HJG60_008564 [Phyllostomus discolor]
MHCRRYLHTTLAYLMPNFVQTLRLKIMLALMERIEETGSGSGHKAPCAQLYVVCQGDGSGCLEWGGDLVVLGALLVGPVVIKSVQDTYRAELRQFSCFASLGNGSMTSEPLSCLLSFWAIVLHQIAVIIGKEDDL